MKSTKVDLANNARDFLYLILGVLSAAFGLEGFLMPSGFIDGGVTGISLMVNG